LLAQDYPVLHHRVVDDPRGDGTAAGARGGGGAGPPTG
jgi:hypothetical protein